MRATPFTRAPHRQTERATPFTLSPLVRHPRARRRVGASLVRWDQGNTATPFTLAELGLRRATLRHTLYARDTATRTPPPPHPLRCHHLRVIGTRPCAAGLKCEFHKVGPRHLRHTLHAGRALHSARDTPPHPLRTRHSDTHCAAATPFTLSPLARDRDARMRGRAQLRIP